jgi:methylenetetrahydrofolate reductase (NADPH)
VGASKGEIAEIAEQYWQAGVRHIVALRGDPPAGAGAAFAPHPEGYASAAELVAGLRSVHDFEISVAAYPEVHPEAVSAEVDLDNLKRKLDAGASQAITQFFFDPEVYFRFLDKALAAGITAPILPGIMPITSVAAIRRMSANTTIPAWMERAFAGLETLPGARELVAATLAAEFCRRLYDGGVRDFHFYTLNRAEQAYAICHLLGLRPSGDAA